MRIEPFQQTVNNSQTLSVGSKFNVKLYEKDTVNVWKVETIESVSVMGDKTTVTGKASFVEQVELRSLMDLLHETQSGLFFRTVGKWRLRETITGFLVVEHETKGEYGFMSQKVEWKGKTFDKLPNAVRAVIQEWWELKNPRYETRPLLDGKQMASMHSNLNESGRYKI